MPKKVSIGVKLEADSKQFISAVGLGSKQLKELKNKSDVAGGSIKKLGGNFASFGSVIRLGLLAGYVRQLTELTDANKRMAGQLSLVTDGSEQLADVQERLLDVANNTRTALEPTVALYARLARNTTSLRLTQQDLLDLTTATNQALQIAGATTREAAAGVIQFSQGLASGRLSGDEFRSVVENMPRLARAIADGMDVDISQLRRLSREGKLTAEVLTAAIASQRDILAKEYEKLPKRVEQSLTQLNNEFVSAFRDVDTSNINSAIDDITKTIASEGFQQGLESVADFVGQSIRYMVDNADTIIKVFGAISGAKIGGSLGSILGPKGGAIGGALGLGAGFLLADDAISSVSSSLTEQISEAYKEVQKNNKRLNQELSRSTNQRYLDGLRDNLDKSIKAYKELLVKQRQLASGGNSKETSVGSRSNKGNAPAELARNALEGEKDSAIKPLNQLLDKLKAQNAAFGQGSTALIEYNLQHGKYAENIRTLNTIIKEGKTDRLVGGSDEGSAIKRQIIEQLRLVESKKASAKLDKEAAAIRLSLLTPLEEFNKKQAKLNELLAAGKISQQEASKASREYKKALMETNPLLKDAQKVFEDTRNETEKYNKEIEKLNKLLNSGAFDNLGGIETYNRAVEKAKEDLSDLNSESSKFAQEAASNIQDAFADFLFDPFSDGLDGMLNGFADTLRRMSAEAVSAQLAKQLLGEDFEKTGKVGGILSDIAGTIGTPDFGGFFEDKSPTFNADNTISGESSNSGTDKIVNAVVSTGAGSTAKTIAQSAADAILGTTAVQTGALTTQAAIAAQTASLVASNSASASAIVAAISASNTASAVAGGTSGIDGAISLFSNFGGGLPTFHSGGISQREQLAVLLKNEEVLTRSDPRHSKNNSDSYNNTTVSININATDAQSVIRARGQIERELVSSLNRAQRNA